MKGDGTVVAWGCAGTSNYAQCSVPSGLAGVTAIAADQVQSLALKGDGTVVSWGCSFFFTFGQCGVPSGLAGVTAVAAGYYHSLALKADGTVAAWGCGSGFDSGQCSPPSGLSRVSAIAAGEHHSLAVIELTNQAITFDPIPNKTYGRDPDFTAGATSSSALPISFAAKGSCTVNGATVHLRLAGSCTVTASQPGDANYNAAADVSRTFAIATAPVAPPPASRPPVAPTPRVSARCRVPNVVGKRVASAKRTIAGRHCRTGKVGYAYSRKRKKGIVISQSRPPGRLLPARSKINLVISRGRKR